MFFHEVDIPRIFHSEYTEQPFASCIDCERDLAESGEVYTVMKHFVLSETVFEMAICMSCAVQCRERYSEVSLANIQQFIQEHLPQGPDKEKRRRRRRPGDDLAECNRGLRLLQQGAYAMPALRIGGSLCTRESPRPGVKLHWIGIALDDVRRLQ